MTLESLPNEILGLVFYHLQDPAALSCASRRLHRVSQDPYVRAHYFLTRYGSLEALYFALARGKLLTPRVLDILLASGAHLSRYLVQVTFHHFFHSQSHFLKPSSRWARHVSLATFSHFLKIAADKYGDIPKGKNEDDGSLFATFIKESKFPPESQRVSWETIRDIFENYHFIPFCPRDPLMAQFPLALAIEPRLLPYAVANGFQMDAKYRDFVFRKMFERTATPAAAHTEEIVANVRELCRLDSDMFVTRTVAAEVCLEAKTNEAAYGALKQLDRAGDLPFALRGLVQDVIKLYSKARAITTSATTQILTQLYNDFLAPPPVPAALASSSRAHSTSRALIDPTVRRAMLLTVFAAEPPIPVSAMAARLAPLRLGPLTIKDVADVLLSAFVDKHAPLFDYIRREGVASGESVEGTRKPTPAELRMLAEEVAVHCLTRESKGRTLKRLCDAYPTVRVRIIQAVLEDHEFKLHGLGDVEEGNEPWRAQLARGALGGIVVSENEASESDWELEQDEEEDDEDDDDEDEDDELDSDSDMSDDSMSESEGGKAGKTKYELGRIGLEPLSAMIRRDEQGGRGRRRYYPMIYGTSLATSSRVLPDSMSVARWIKMEFGAHSSVTATYLMHALVNGNHSILSLYLGAGAVSVPITLKHFQALAKIGSPCVDFYMYDRIKEGAPFYATENDYLAGADSARLALKKMKGKGREGAPAPGTPPRIKAEPDVKVEVTSSPPRGKKRPRRSAATVVSSYMVPDSDDEAIADEDDRNDEFAEFRMPGGGAKRKTAKVERVETSLEAWVKALGVLLKEEQRKYREKKKRVDKEKAAGSGVKIRLCKSDFFRSLTTNLRALRELATEKRMFRVADGEDIPESDGEDDEYVQQKDSRTKRRKTIT